MPALEHIRLDQSTRQIRLLRFVEPRFHDQEADTGPISCLLDTYDLDDGPSFVALSYAWGDMHPRQKISLNGDMFPVRPNLHSALSVLRERYLHYMFWIDAICINQQDDSERSHQVNMMGTIYSEARFVLVWLGPRCADSESDMRRLIAHSAPLTGRIPEQSEKEIERLTPKSGILTHAYWERMWVVQEFTLAKHIFLLQGHCELTFEHLENIVYRTGVVTPEDPMYSLVSCRLRWKQTSAFTVSETTLDSLISAFQTSKCSDVRDNIYALLSLVRTLSDNSKPLYPDYTISPRQLYYRVLGNVRQSPTLRDTTDWKLFRARLRSILNIPRDEDFERNDLLYLISERERPHRKPLLSLHPDHRTTVGHALLDHVANYLQWPPTDMTRDTQRIYKEIISSFQQFPREEDPEAWNCFDNLLKEVLGLRTTRGEDSQIWNMFINFPE